MCLGCEVGGRALVEVLPVVLFSEKVEQQVMALRDSGCNTTKDEDEGLAQLLGLKCREIELQIQGVNAEKAFISQHIKNCRIARVGREQVKYVLRDVKTFPNLSGQDQKIKWSAIKENVSHLKDLDLKDTDTCPVRLIIGSNNSDFILPMRIVKPSGQSHADRVRYAVESPLGWAVTNWFPGERKVASAYNALKVYETSSGEEEELQLLLTARSEVESLGVVKLADLVRSIVDRRELAVMEQTTKKLEGEDAYV